MPNFEGDSAGTVHVAIMNPDVTLEAGKQNSLIDGSGAAIVVHAGADDYKSQPSGDAGKRIACGVITLSE
jgi:Cu-Zn family superoxide dismutase